MFLLGFLTRRRPERRSLAPRLNCDELEGRQLLTASAGPRVRPGSVMVDRVRPMKVPRLGTPKPTQSSPFAHLKAADGSPKVFQDSATARSTQGLDGSGFAVAVIDTGVDYSLSALGQGFGAGHKVVGGYDFGMNDNDPAPTWNHGTAVSSVIAATDPANPGIAPGADIVALRVFDDGGNSTFARIADALDWVVANHKKFNITVVNISLSDSMNYTLNWFQHDTSHGQRVSDAVTKLKGLNIAVVSAAGNSFKGREGMGFTGIIKDTISVTGVDPSTGQLAANAQRLGSAIAGELATDIAAPSSGFRAITGNGSFESVDGTSFSAPIVSGAIVLMQQKYMREFGTLPSVSQLETWLKQGGKPTIDPVTKLNIPQLDLASSLALIPTKPSGVATNVVPKPPAPVNVTPPIVVVTPTPTPTPAPPVLNTTPIPPVVVLPVPVPTSPLVVKPVNPPAETNAQAPAPVIRINGSVVTVGQGAGSNLSLESFQGSIRWQNVQMWTGESVARRSADTSAVPVPTGTLQQNSAKARQVTKVTTPRGFLRRHLPKLLRVA